MMIESLETRRLMSVSFSPATGLVTVVGKNDWLNTDEITASVSAGKLKVNDNGTVHTFAASKVKKIAIYARNGADEVTLAPSVFIPSYIDSGNGHPAGSPGDVINGGSGNDVIVMRTFYGSARGNAGNDRLENHNAFNSLHGDAGNDTLVNKLSSTSESGWNGGTGVDTMDYSASTESMVLRNGTVGWYYPDISPPVVAGPGADFVSNCENFYSGSGDDYIFGTAGKNVLRGNAGNDHIRGGAGDDIIVGGTGKDAMFGEAGNDTFYARDWTQDFVSGGYGTDKANRDAIDILNSVEASF